MSERHMENLIQPAYREEPCTLTDETRQAPCATGTLDQRTPDNTLDDVTACDRGWRFADWLGFPLLFIRLAVWSLGCLAFVD